MKKIAFNMTSASHGGGFKTYNDNILLRLLKDNNRETTYYIFVNDKNIVNKNKNVQIIYVSKLFSRTIPRIIWMQLILPFYLIFKKIDIFFSPMNILPILFPLSKIKTILVIHSNLPWLFPDDSPGSKIKKTLQRGLINKSIDLADKIIVDSNNAKDELLSLFNNINEKVISIYLGVDFNFFRKRNNKISQSDLKGITSPYFLTISSAVKYHCLIELIIAYENLCNEFDTIPDYVILSKNLDNKYYKLLTKKIERSKYKNKIKLIEDINKEAIPSLYNNASLYIFSSYCEVFGLTNLEAMYSGIPVITSNRSSLPEICGDAAIYTNPKDPIDIKDKMISLFFNEELKGKLINNGFNNVKNFSWDNTFKQTLKVISSFY